MGISFNIKIHYTGICTWLQNRCGQLVFVHKEGHYLNLTIWNYFTKVSIHLKFASRSKLTTTCIMTNRQHKNRKAGATKLGWGSHAKLHLPLPSYIKIFKELLFEFWYRCLGLVVPSFDLQHCRSTRQKQYQLALIPVKSFLVLFWHLPGGWPTRKWCMDAERMPLGRIPSCFNLAGTTAEFLSTAEFTAFLWTQPSEIRLICIFTDTWQIA